MDEQGDSKLQQLKIISNVLICVGTIVTLVVLRILSSWVIRRCFLLDSSTHDEISSSDSFMKNLCEIPMLSWLYPIATTSSLILLMSPEVIFSPLLGWKDWADTITCIHIGHLFTKIIASVIIWRGEISFKFKANIIHYLSALAINIVCITNAQMPVLVLVGIVAQLPLLFSTINTISSKSICTCLWTSSWLLWIMTQLACTFVVPGIFVIEPLISQGIPQGLSTVSTVALFWAISYFGVLFMWEMHRPIKVLLGECRTHDDDFFNLDVTSVPIFYTERSPLVSVNRIAEVKNQISIP